MIVLLTGRKAASVAFSSFSSISSCTHKTILRSIHQIRRVDIPTPIFATALQTIRNDKARWKMIYEYDKFDAWIDYGEVHYESIDATIPNGLLIFSWTNWLHGEISGPADIVENLLKLPSIPK